MKRYFCICGALGWGLIVPSALAQTAVQELGPMVVEARLDSIIPAYFAGNSSVIEEKAIRQSGARSVADLLMSQGGVQVKSFSGNASGGAVSLRGFGENSSSRVLLMVDGRPLNRPDMAAASLLEVPLSRIARVEILRGSQTARFGDQAVGGVINFVTKSPDKPRSSIEAAGGSDLYSLLRLAHDGRYAGNGVAFDFERNFSSGWRENSASELQSAALRWDREVGESAELRAGGSWADEFTGLPGPLSEKQYWQNPRQSIYEESGSSAQYFSKQMRHRADAGLLLGKGEDLSFDLPVAYSHSDQEWNLGPGFHSDTLLETWAFTPVARFARDHVSGEIGLNGRFENLSLTQFKEISRTEKTGHAELERRILGGFTSAEWEPAAGWHLSAAARWQQTAVDATATSFLFPSDPAFNFSRGNHEMNQAYQLGLRWEPRTDFSTWLRGDLLYRLPSTDEIASYQGLPLSVPFNDQLKAETGHNFELGSEYQLAGWKLRANGFFQQLHGEIIYDYQKNLNTNFADTQRLGTEIDLRYQAERWEVDVHYTQLNASFQSGRYRGKNVCLVPEQALTANFTIRPTEHLTAQAEWSFTSAAYEGNDFKNNQPKLPSYAIANLILRYQPKPGVLFYTRINNLLDERYATIKYSGVWYPAAGRSFQCGVRHEF